MTNPRGQFDLLKASGKLPSPTGIALRVLEIARRDDATFQNVAQILKSDPALAGKVLQIVNAARFGLPKPTADISVAVSQLGLRTTAQLALGFSVVASCPRGKCAHFDYEGFWLRSLATALIAQTLSAQSKRFYSSEAAYTCGLLCQVGRLVLATVHPECYSKLLKDLAIDDPSELVEAEVASFGIDHNFITSMLLRDWGLPDDLVTGSLVHEEPEKSRLDHSRDAMELSYILKFSSLLAKSWLSEAVTREQLKPQLLQLGQRYDMSYGAFAALLEAAMVDWKPWCSLMELRAPKIASFEQDIKDIGIQPDNTEKLPEPRQGVLRILLIDDNPICVRAMERHLDADNHQIATARNGLEGLRLALDFSPHIIITDWLMPEMNGLELCQTLRKSELGCKFHIIIITSLDDRNNLNEAFDAGCDDYLTKPVHPQELQARIRAASRSIRFQEELAREKSEMQRFAAELSIGNRILERKATTDSLTGLPNRGRGYDQLKEAWEFAIQHRQPLACLMIDIDHFKEVNDTHGHAVGDAVLQQTACVLNDAIRGSDMICRYGGEEFMMICNLADEARGRLTAERIRAIVESNTVHSVAFTGCVTVSVGVATLSDDMTDVEMLLKCADDALYEAKRSGRNCVRVYRDFEAADSTTEISESAV